MVLLRWFVHTRFSSKNTTTVKWFGRKTALWVCIVSLSGTTVPADTECLQYGWSHSVWLEMQRTGVTQYVTPSSSTNGSGNTGMAQFGLEKYTFSFLFFFKLYNSLTGNLCHVTWVQLQQPQEQHYSFLPMWAVLLCIHHFCIDPNTWKVLKNTIRTKQHARAKLRWRVKTRICFWLSCVVLTQTT